MIEQAPSIFETGSSIVNNRCQVCESTDLHSALFLGYLPPVNQMWKIGERPHEQPGFPAEVLYCNNCALVQLGLTVDAQVLFPPDYPYTSGTTNILHKNFQNLHAECVEILAIESKDLIIDIGSNDGTLLSKFQTSGHPVHGIEPTDAADLAIANNIMTTKAFFSRDTAKQVKNNVGEAILVTATNCFAHIANVHDIVRGVIDLMAPNGVFVCESHYLMDLLDSVQYDTIYHEHLRYYSLTSLKNLVEMHGLEIIHATLIPTHGGSVRVYASQRGTRPINPSVDKLLLAERNRGPLPKQLEVFKKRVVESKVQLHAIFKEIKSTGQHIFGIGAPSRASTLVNYVGIDDGIIDCVVEISSSKKIGRYLPGTLIPVVKESKLLEQQPDYALILAWHIADELISKLRDLGFNGKFITPLPEPRIN